MSLVAVSNRKENEIPFRRYEGPTNEIYDHPFHHYRHVMPLMNGGTTNNACRLTSTFKGIRILILNTESYFPAMLL